MHRPIAFDLTRLALGALGDTPRGIDRVDLSFANRLFGRQGEPHVGLLPGPFRMGRVPGPDALAIVHIVERAWRERAPASGDDAIAALSRWLCADGIADAASRTPVTRSLRDKMWHTVALMRQARRSLGAPAAGSVPRGAVYLNTGQVLLGFPWVFGWLDERPDVKAVFTLHDLIPLTHPEYSGPILTRHHARALATVARRGTALLATSHASADEITTGLRRLGRTDMPVHVVPLPVSPTLLEGAAGDLPPLPEPYFVAVGILDQRKNHRLLWHVWRDLLRRRGPAIPKLVVIGARGLRTRELHDLLARSPGLDGVVRVVSGLPSGAVRTLVAGARGLLMPSFAEGFGLPVIEAAALGVPVVASDIPAHREATAGTDAVLLDPLDGPGWSAAVLRLAAGDPLRRRRTGPAPQTWDSYFAAVLPWLESL